MIADPFALVGTTIADKFRVERVLGEGGFGVVYAGTHLVLGIPVAIKCLKTGDPAPFLREARILATLSHPAIVRLFDAGTVSGGNIPYAALELLTGSTLADDILARAPTKRHYSRDEIASIFCTILEGVAFAHERGVVHRDLKPANIMLVPESGRMQPKVLDFGTARAEIDTLHGAGASLGAGFTPLYAAPEQWDKARGEVSARTDVYALGLTLAEMCLLGHPFPSAHSLGAIMESTFDETRRPSLSAARPDLPVEVEAVIRRALRVRAEERQANARELLVELRGALRTSPETAPMARPMSRPLAPSTSPPSPVFLDQTSAVTAPPAPMASAAPRPNRLPWILTGIFLTIALVAVVAGVFAAMRLMAP